MKPAIPIEITPRAVLLGILLSVILAGANAYLGLFAGLTVSASIPAAVISMGILSAFKNSNIKENNIVQTAASAGESLAAGVIFTIPALVLMGHWERFDYLETARIAAIGGIIGVLFTVPLRRALIIESDLTFPEGIATAEVLRTGERARDGNARGESGIGLLAGSAVTAAVMKLAQQAFQLWDSSIIGAISFGRDRKALFGSGIDLSPALLAVGYIIGRNIASLIFIGGALSWLIAIPLYSWGQSLQGADFAAAKTLWSEKIRYLGVGAMVVGGLWSIVGLIEPLKRGIQSSMNAFSRRNSGKADPSEMDIPFPWVIAGILLSILPVFFVYHDTLHDGGIALLLSVVMLVFGFLFSAVAGYMAGLVGSSNNPISGVTIATILFASLLLLAVMGAGSTAGAAGAILIGAVVCCAASIAGDNMQDLKTGRLVGATPWKQQVMQIVGTVAAAMTLGVTLQVLHSAYTIGSDTLPAPQATLMRSVAEGVFHGGLPWNFVGAGCIIGALIIMADLWLKRRKSSFRAPVLAVAVGLYLPISLSTAIFLGGLIAHTAAKGKPLADGKGNRGVLLASGLITGEALMGILVAVPIFITADKDWWPALGSVPWAGPVLFLGVLGWLYFAARRSNTEL
ncbi:MAG TPA: oligopeptide transporter, OPT family [Spirochaetes bacterium]|nr:oligopeptide transporter, OPT family [Spirochaetota bacterium]